MPADSKHNFNFKTGLFLNTKFSHRFWKNERRRISVSGPLNPLLQNLVFNECHRLWFQNEIRSSEEHFYFIMFFAHLSHLNNIYHSSTVINIVHSLSNLWICAGWAYLDYGAHTEHPGTRRRRHFWKGKDNNFPT